MIASYYKAIADFDAYLLSKRDEEIRRIIFEGTKEEKAQCNNLFNEQ